MQRPTLAQNEALIRHINPTTDREIPPISSIVYNRTEEVQGFFDRNLGQRLH